jgi:hypothetical protein
MTTIAWDGFHLATDTKITNGDHLFGFGKKIHKLNDGSYLAAAGSQDFIYSVIDWLNGGEKPEIKDDDRFIGLIISLDENGNKMQTELSERLRKWPACVPWAGGTGEPYALTAMMCGKNAIEAVRIACEMDPYSGGQVESIHDFHK